MAPRIEHLREPVRRVTRTVALGHLADAAAARDRLAAATDPEALHDFRVALRRLRSWERAFRPYFEDDLPKKVRRKLRDLASDTGASRDLEVHLAWLAEQRGPLTRRQRTGLTWLSARLRARKEAADATLGDDVHRRFDRLRERLERALTSYREEIELGPAGRIAPPAPFARELAPRVRDAMTEVRDHLAQVRSIDDEEQGHEARIAAKRLRYLLEPVTKLVPGAAEAVDRLKALQDVLGNLHDAHVFTREIIAFIDEVDRDEARRAAVAAEPNGTLMEGDAATGFAAGAAASDEPRPPAETPAPTANPDPGAMSARPVPSAPARDSRAAPNAGTGRARASSPRDPRPGLHAVAERLHERAEQAFAELDAQWLGGRGDEFFGEVETLAARIDGAATAGLEIERKFLLRYLPDEALDGTRLDIDQGYVPGTDVRERVRRVVVRQGARKREERFYRTMKMGSGMTRIELEEETSREVFDALWRLTRGRRVRKRRFEVPDGEHTWQVDEFRDRKLVLAEVELSSESEQVRLPEWLEIALEREVTGEAEYDNVNLAK